jgi:hypothetical protein
MALVAAQPAALDTLGRALATSPADDPKQARLALAAYRARLARGERAAAADLLIANAARFSPADQADAMAEWMAGSTARASAGVSPSTTARR